MSLIGGIPPSRPGFNLYADQSDHIVRTSIALMTLASCFVVLRLLSRWLARAGFWWDDVLVSIALVFALIPSIMLIWGADHAGFGKHFWALKPDPTSVLPQTKKTLFVLQITFSLATSTVKLSTLAFYRRIFPAVKLGICFFSMAVVVILFMIASEGVQIFQCTPIRKYWDVSLPGHCIPIYNNLIITGSINTALDFLIVFWPVPLLWHLRTSVRQKCILTGIFLMAGL